MKSWQRGGHLLGILVIPVTLILLSFLFLISGGCTSATQEKIELKVICAGSLMVPFTQVEQAYEAQNPHVDVLTEGHGSVQVIRQVTELGTAADVIAVADHSLIPAMMYDVKVPDSDKSYANWYIKFASNTLGLAYTSDSQYADEIDADNWYEILSRPDVKLGISDPRFDACGYRAMMACWLAGQLYGDSDIFHDVLGDFDYPIVPQVQEQERRCEILVPEIIRPHKVSVRGSSVVLLGILESGDIDYAFEYRSVARQRNLHFLELPPEINLGSDEFESLGYDVSVKIDYQRFASLIPDFRCQEILYGVTIPENRPHPEQALDYVRFLLGPAGRRIFAAQHQPFRPLVADNPEHLPDDLIDLLESGP
jgi:molybdate/tungstate transport system substrate-binding protein